MILIHNCELLAGETDQDQMMMSLMPTILTGGKLILTTCSIRTGEISNFVRVCRQQTHLSYGKFIWSDHPERDDQFKNFQLQHLGADVFAREYECIDTIYGN